MVNVNYEGLPNSCKKWERGWDELKLLLGRGGEFFTASREPEGE